MSRILGNRFARLNHHGPWRAAALLVAILLMVVAPAACAGESPEPDAATDYSPAGVHAGPKR